MIDLDERYLQEILGILDEHAPDCEVWAFGSRVTGVAREFSDLDLALIGTEPMDWKRVEALKLAFSESDLPIMVDVVDWRSVSESFRSIIADSHHVLRLATNNETTAAL
jgi:uncharacterized protein